MFRFQLPVKDYRFPMRSIDNWFDQTEVAGKREAIALLIKSLMDKFNPNNNITLPEIYFNTAEEREKGGRASCQVEERERAERLAMEKSRDKAQGRKDGAGATSVPVSAELQQQEKIPGIGDDLPVVNTVFTSAAQPQTSTSISSVNVVLQTTTAALPLTSTEDNGTAENSPSKSPCDDKKLLNQPKKKKESSICTSIDKKGSSIVNNDDKNNLKKNLLNTIPRASKQFLIRPGETSSYSNSGNNVPTKMADGGGNDSAKNQHKSVVGSVRNKKVLGSIPAVKPFGTPGSNKTSLLATPVSDSNLLVGNAQGVMATKILGAGLASIRDTYSFEDDVEDNNNDISNGKPGRIVISGSLANHSVGGSAAVALATISTAIVHQQQAPLRPVTVTESLTDHVHLSKYPILANSLATGSNNIIAAATVASKMQQSKKLTLSTAQNSTAISSIAEKPVIRQNNALSAVNMKFIKEALSNNNQNPMETSTTQEETNSKNGLNLNQFVVGEISGKKAVYSEDNSEVYMYLSSEEGNSQQESDRESISPDLYCDLDGLTNQGQVGDTRDLTNGKTSINSSPIPLSDNISSNVTSFIPALNSTTSEDEASIGANSKTAPACFRFSERGTSSGRVIAPPKRYLEQSTEVKRKKKSSRGSYSGHR